MLSVPARYIRMPLALIAAATVALLIIFIALDRSAEADGNAVSVAAGAGHTCAVTNTGGIQCWGDNEFGQLGTNTNDSTAIPVDVCADGACSEPLQGIVAVTADNDHTCALNEDGGVLCWGRNANGQLGDGSNTDRTTPVGVIGLDSGAEEISAGFVHSCALITGGGVKCWGDNDASQLGNDTSDSSTIPVSVCELVFPKLGQPAGGGPVLPCEPISYATSVSAGSAHTCVVTDESGVKCWGANDSGQLGNDTTDDRDTPDEVCTPIVFKILGDPAPSGVTCTPLSDIVSVSAGAAHTCALESDGGVLCWGLNSFGQLGNDTTIDSDSPIEVCRPLLMIPGAGQPAGVDPNPCTRVTNMASVSAASGHTCGITTTGGARCWGWNPVGNLGDGTTTERHFPVNVDGLGDGEQIVAALVHSCAVRSGGGVQCWGSNGSGRLGDGTNAERHSPVDVFGLGTKATVTPTEGPATATPTITATPAGTVTATATGEPGTPGPTVTPTETAVPGELIGDVDCSGAVNAIDAAFILQLIAGLIESVPCPENADTNEDGDIDAIDATLILQFSAGFLGTLPP